MVDFGHIVEALIKQDAYSRRTRERGGLIEKKIISEGERIVFMFYWLYLLFLIKMVRSLKVCKASFSFTDKIFTNEIRVLTRALMGPVNGPLSIELT